MKTKTPPAKAAKTKPSAAPAPPPKSGPRERSSPAPRSGPAPPARSIDAHEQTAAFERGVALFRKGNLQEARAQFELAGSGPVREMAHAARVHMQVCERRSRQSVAEPSSAEDHYNLAVALINRRELEAAERHLRAADNLLPNQDHIYYALALAQGLRGDYAHAGESLRRAVELNPRNRTEARRDPDFAALLHHPPLAEALRGDKEHGG